MPTDLELITSFNNLSNDAKEVLKKLADFVTTNGTVNWQLSGGVTVSADSLPKMISGFNGDIDTTKLAFYKDFGDAVTATATYNSDGSIATETVTFASGWQMIKTPTYSSGRVATIGLVLKDDTAVTQWTGTRTFTYDSAGNLTSIS